MNGIQQQEYELTASLLERLEKPLPQRVINVDTNEKADEFRLGVSGEERDHLIRILRRAAACFS